MGEIADAILEGMFCEWCGDFLGDEVGYPRKCPDCEKLDQKITFRRRKKKPGKATQ